MKKPVFLAKQTTVSEDFFRPPASFADGRSRHQYIAEKLKNTAHVSSQIDREVAGDDLEFSHVPQRNA